MINQDYLSGTDTIRKRYEKKYVSDSLRQIMEDICSMGNYPFQHLMAAFITVEDYMKPKKERELAELLQKILSGETLPCGLPGEGYAK